MSSPSRQWGEPINNCYLRNAHDAHGPGTRGMFLWHSSLRDENHDVEPHPIEPLVKHVHGWHEAMETVARDEAAISQKRQALIRGHDSRQAALTMEALRAQREVMPSDHASGGARWTRGLLQKAQVRYKVPRAPAP